MNGSSLNPGKLLGLTAPSVKKHVLISIRFAMDFLKYEK